jgi:hypothetical protein
MERTVEMKDARTKSSTARVMGVKEKSEKEFPRYFAMHHPRKSSTTLSRRKADLTVSKPR